MELTRAQIHVILWDITRRGITLPALQEDVLDHICCMVEEEMEITPDFKTAYLRVRNTFKGLSLLQAQTEKEIESSGKHAALLRLLKNIFTFYYLIIGVSFLALPLILFVAEFNVFLLSVFPLSAIGYMICFKRIDYKHFDIIPFKESLSPVKITF